MFPNPLMMRRGLATAVVAAVLLNSSSAEACKCSTDEKPDEQYAAIFEALLQEEWVSKGGR